MELLETIKCIDGKLFNLKWHNFRFNQSRKIHFGLNTKMSLANFIKIPVSARKGTFRCRISYSNTIEKIEFLPHDYNQINSLKLVVDNDIDYHLKYSNRNRLHKLYEKRGNCDDILIVKNGCITDSYTANPVFYDGSKWWTSTTPLLQGTQRAKLLEENKIFECWITPEDLSKYTKVGLINALQDLNDMPVVEIENILK